MSSNKRANAVIGILGIFINLPIWYYLLHTLLAAAQVDRLCWFLYWIYVPVGLLIAIIDKVFKGAE